MSGDDCRYDIDLSRAKNDLYLAISVAFEPMSRREFIYSAGDDVEVVRKTSSEDNIVRDLRWRQRSGFVADDVGLGDGFVNGGG